LTTKARRSERDRNNLQREPVYVPAKRADGIGWPRCEVVIHDLGDHVSMALSSAAVKCRHDRVPHARMCSFLMEHERAFAEHWLRRRSASPRMQVLRRGSGDCSYILGIREHHERRHVHNVECKAASAPRPPAFDACKRPCQTVDCFQQRSRPSDGGRALLCPVGLIRRFGSDIVCPFGRLLVATLTPPSYCAQAVSDLDRTRSPSMYLVRYSRQPPQELTCCSASNGGDLSWREQHHGRYIRVGRKLRRRRPPAPASTSAASEQPLAHAAAQHGVTDADFVQPRATPRFVLL